MARCRSCRALIRWARTLKNKPIPLEHVGEGKGNVRIERGVAIVGRPGSGDHISHFATCPNAAQHRKPR